MKAKQELEQLILNAIENGSFPGANYAVVTKDKVWMGSLGNKEVYPNVVENNIDTIYDMASCSKVVSTTTCIMLLLQRGQIRLYDYIKKYEIILSIIKKI